MKLKLFGGVYLESDNGRTVPIHTQRARALIAYLALRPGFKRHREQVCAALWPDTAEPAARSQLRKALWRVRSSFGEAGGEAALCVGNHELGLAPDLMTADNWTFAAALARVELKHDCALDCEDAERLLEAVRLARGAFASGITDDWAEDEARRLDRARLAAIERLIAFHTAHSQWVQAIEWAQRALSHDNLREHLHRIIMGCHMSMGDRGSALRQYRLCAEILRNELGIEPMEETRALRDAILEGKMRQRPSTVVRAEPSDRTQPPGRRRTPAIRELDTAMTALSTIRRSLEHARDELQGEPPA